MKILCVIYFQTCLLLCAIGASASANPFPADMRVVEGLVVEEGIATASKNLVVRGAAPSASNRMTLVAKAGSTVVSGGQFLVSLTGRDGKLAKFYLSAREMKVPKGKEVLTTSFVEALSGKYHVKPNPKFYTLAECARRQPEWDKLPTAADFWFNLDLQPLPAGGTGAWLQGQYMGKLDVEGPFTDYWITMQPGAAVRSLQWHSTSSDLRFMPLSVEDNPRPGSLAGARLVLDDAAQLPIAFRQLAESNSEGISVNGLGRIPGLANGEHTTLFWSRNATDNLPEQRMFNVPQDNYSYAQVLCAADSDPTTEDAFTLRVTRYANGRGNGLADSQVVVPASPAQASATATARVVGKVTDAAGKPTPLWLIRVPLKTGLIDDIIRLDKRTSDNMSRGYLDVEFLDPLRGVTNDEKFPPSLEREVRSYSPVNHVGVQVFDPRATRESVWPTSDRSGVTVYGALLERAPAALELQANTDTHVFTAADNPAWKCTVRADVSGQYTLQWEFADVDGKIAASGKSNLELRAGSSQTVEVPVQVGNGWYAARFCLLTAGGEVVTDQRPTFVFLPPDTRQAGYESPFGTWWFSNSHGGEPNIERVGPLLQRAGLRRATLPPTLPESVTDKYGVTSWPMSWHWGLARKPTIEEGLAAYEEEFRKFTELYPSEKRFLVWHEDGPGGAAFPVEMWGSDAGAASEAAEKHWQPRFDFARALVKMAKEKYPQLKPQFGNDGHSLFAVAETLRRQMPREYIGSFATENAGQSIAPEKPTQDGLQALWYLRETARKLGYGDVPVTASYEWMYRADIEAGQRRQAEWYVRDALHGLAYGLDAISLGTTFDANGGYYYSLWGSAGLAERYPVMQPKPSYAAVATLTRVLDRAQFLRAVPTGSLGVYSLEFKLPQGYAYALWVPHGRVAVTLRFNQAARRVETDLYGRETVHTAATIPLDLHSGAVYLTSDEPLEAISLGTWTFPGDPVPEHSTLVDDMSNISGWTIAQGTDAAFDRPGGIGKSNQMPLRVRGDFELRTVIDDEKGRCLELELKPRGELWDGIHEYAVLTPLNPLLVQGKFNAVGVWVKGNGSFGDVMWKLENAKGEKWTTPVMFQDWPARNNTNYDGWSFLSMKLPEGEAWKAGVKVVGLAVTIPRKTLFLTEMVPVPNKTLRFKGIALY